MQLNFFLSLFSKSSISKITDLSYRLHGWLGFKFSILLFVISFTGSFLVLQRPVEWLLYKEMRIVPQGQFDFDRVHQNILEKYPNVTITRIKVPYASRMVSTVYLEVPVGDYIGGASLYCNPYTGEIISGPHYSAWNLRYFIVRTHAHLSLGGNGYYIVCFIGVILLGIVLFSIPLLRMSLRSILFIRLTKGRRIFYSDLHKFMGVWSFIFLLIIGVTVSWFFTRSVIVKVKNKPFFSKVLFFHPKSTTPKLFKEKLDEYPEKLKISVNFNQVLQQVYKKIPGFSLTNIYFGISKMEPWVLFGREGTFSHNRGSAIYIDPFSGKIIEIRREKDLSMGEKFSQLMDVLHFGYFWGVTSMVLWGIFGIFLTFLSFTGVLIRWKSVSKIKDKNLGYFKYVITFLLCCTLWYGWDARIKKNATKPKVIENINFIYEGISCEIRRTIFRSKLEEKEIISLYVYFQDAFNFRNSKNSAKAFLQNFALEKKKQTGGFAIFSIPNKKQITLIHLQKQIRIEL